MQILALKAVTLIRDSNRLLAGINWSVATGEHWALLGRNGSGKTMLTRVVAGYEWPTAGTVDLLDKRLGKTDIRILREHVRWVGSEVQSRVTQSDIVLSIVLSGYKGTIGLYEKVGVAEHKKAIELLDKLGIAETAGKPYELLSYGQQRRVLIARSMITRPQLLMLDEPCNGLDVKAKHEYLQWVNELMSEKQGPSVVMITHHIDEIMPNITHVLLIKNGMVFKKGKKEEVLTDENLTNVLEMPIRIKKHNGYYFIQ